MTIEYISISLTAIFGLASIYFYLRSRRYKQIAIVQKKASIKADSNPSISISVEGKQVRNLNKLLIVVFNAGTLEIRQEDIPNSGFPKVRFIDAILLSHRIVIVSNDKIGFRTESNADDELFFKFDYLNPNDGAVIELLYEELGSEKKKPIEYETSLIGARPALIESYMYRPWIPIIFITAVFSGAILFLGLSQLYVFIVKGYDPLALMGGLLTICIAIFVGWYTIVKQYKEASIPVPKFASEMFKDLNYPVV